MAGEKKRRRLCRERDRRLEITTTDSSPTTTTTITTTSSSANSNWNSDILFEVQVDIKKRAMTSPRKGKERWNNKMKTNINILVNVLKLSSTTGMQTEESN